MKNLNKDDHSEVKLLNENIKVTDKDLWEFNAWIKSKNIEPKLRGEFESDIAYEDFMLDYDGTKEYSEVLIPFDQAGTYAPDSKEYEYLSSIDEPIYEQLMIKLGENGLKIEYDSTNDEFRVFCNDSNPKSSVKSESKSSKYELPFSVGTYGPNTKEYKYLDKMLQGDWEQMVTDLGEEGLNIYYDVNDDEFKVVDNSKFYSTEHGMLGVFYDSEDNGKMIIANEVGDILETSKSDDLNLLNKYGIPTDIKIHDIQDYTTKNFKVKPKEFGKCPESGCIEKDENGKWRIISNKTGKYWPQTYDTEENAKDALSAYHASRG